VEGFFHCLKVHQAGCGNVVALMGASVSDRQSELLDTYFREWVVMLDGDEAGRRASRMPAGRWRTWLGCRQAGNATNCRAKKSNGFCAERGALPEHEDGMAVSANASSRRFLPQPACATEAQPPDTPGQTVSRRAG
jgi:hypothetical protein